MNVRIKIPPKFTVQDDGILVSADVDIVNFGSGVSVTNDGYGKVSVTGFGGGGGSGVQIKAGIVSSGTFSGNPKKATVTFTSAFTSSNYAIIITGIDSRSWSYESKTAAGFTINTNANAALTGEVSWHAIISGEFS